MKPMDMGTLGINMGIVDLEVEMGLTVPVEMDLTVDMGLPLEMDLKVDMGLPLEMDLKVDMGLPLEMDLKVNMGIVDLDLKEVNMGLHHQHRTCNLGVYRQLQSALLAQTTETTLNVGDPAPLTPNHNTSRNTRTPNLLDLAYSRFKAILNQ